MASSTTLTPEQRTLRARAAAYAMHAQGKTNLGPARAAYLERFEREVDPDGTLPTEERAKRARQAHRAHMAILSFKASKARENRTKKAAAEAQDPATASRRLEHPHDQSS